MKGAIDQISAIRGRSVGGVSLSLSLTQPRIELSLIDRSIGKGLLKRTDGGDCAARLRAQRRNNVPQSQTAGPQECGGEPAGGAENSAMASDTSPSLPRSLRNGRSGHQSPLNGPKNSGRPI